MNTLGARIAVAVVAFVVLVGFVWWAFTRGGDPPDLTATGTTVAPVPSVDRGDEELPFDDPVDEPDLPEDPGDPPPEQETSQRWPMVSDAAIASADQSIELSVPGGGRVLVLVDCDSPAFGMGIGVAGVGLAPDSDVVGLLSPETTLLPGIMTDPSGNGFRVITVPLPSPSYRLTFPSLGNLSTSFDGCPEYYTDTTTPG
jgi:hypothetical protein